MLFFHLFNFITTFCESNQLTIIYCDTDVFVQNLMIDEADEAMPGQQASRKRSQQEMPTSPRPSKRKPGQYVTVCKLIILNGEFKLSWHLAASLKQGMVFGKNGIQIIGQQNLNKIK